MDLGQRISVHRGRVGAGGWLWYLGALCLASGVLGLARGGPGNGAERVQTSLAALGVGVVLLIVPILRWRQMVEVFEHGFVWTRLLGVVRVARPEIRDATLIRHRSRQGTREEVKVELVSGKAYSIVGVEQADQLVNLLRARAPNPASEQRPGSSAPGSPAPGWSPGAWKPPGS